MHQIRVTDQTGEQIVIDFPPRRIVSLVPSQTELLYDLGAAEQVYAITKFCIHPAAWTETKTTIGGTKDFDPSAILALEPDLVIGNKEENDRERIVLLRRSVPVWMSDIVTLDQALEMIRVLGVITGHGTGGAALAARISERFVSLKPRGNGLRALYLIWRKPWMAAGIDTFIHDMLLRNGFQNAVEESRYPILDDASMRALKPDVILLSSEPFPFNDRHAGELSQLMSHTPIVFVDGERFSWYGSRLLAACDYFESLNLPWR